MSDYFIHNSRNILPQYSTGIIGYSQTGSPGDDGEQGNSVYYTAYELTPGCEEISKAVYRILKNEQLSDNIDASIDGEYAVGDFIIDCTGNFYKIESISHVDVNISPCYDIIKSGYSDITETFIGFSTFCNTSFLKSSNKKWKMDNPYYDEDSDKSRATYSPKHYHHNRLEKYIYGNHIKFKLAVKSGREEEVESKYLFKYVLVFPSGRTFEKYSKTLSDQIFIENKMLMGEYSRNEGRMFADFMLADIKKDNSKKVIFSEDDFAMEIDSSTVEMSMKEILKKHLPIYRTDSSTDESITQLLNDAANGTSDDSDDKNNYLKVLDVWYNGLEDKEFSILCSYFIMCECHAYVEVISLENGLVYRIDMTDKFINEDNTENTSNPDFVDKATNSINWKPNIYDNIYDSGSDVLRDNYITYIDPSTNEERIYNPFFAYAFFSSDDQSDADVQLSENSIVETAHFIDASGMKEYLAVRAEELYPEIADEENKNIRFKDASIGSSGYLTENDMTFFEGETPSKYGGDTMLAHIAKQYNVYDLSAEPTADIQTVISNLKQDKNRTLKLSFTGLSSISINVIYEKYAVPVMKTSGETVEYPQALVYIGFPDTPLLELNDPETKGIWYLTKFVPPGYYVADDESSYIHTSHAGITDVTINLADFNKNDANIHYIEIGITMLDMYDAGADREYINSGHRASYSQGTDDIAYVDKLSFLNGNKISSGIPDLKIYVNRIDEADYVVKSEETTDESFFTSIHRDYPEGMVV